MSVMSSSHRDLSNIGRNEALHKKQQELAKQYIKEKAMAEHASHIAEHHRRHAVSFGHAAKNVGRGFSLIGYLIIILVVAFSAYLVAKKYGWL